MKINLCVRITHSEFEAQKMVSWLDRFDFSSRYQPLLLGEFGIYIDVDIEESERRTTADYFDGFIDAGKRLAWPIRA